MTTGVKVPFELCGNHYRIAPYRSSQEKDILIMLSFEVTDLDEYLTLIGFYEAHNINKTDILDDEKKALLWKYREVSLGNEVSVKYTCNECGRPNESEITFESFTTTCENPEPGIKATNIIVNDENIHKFCDLTEDEIDALDINDYDELLEKIRKHQIVFDFNKHGRCLGCGVTQTFDFGDPGFLLGALSDERIDTMYKVYSTLTYFANFTKQDVDSMYPFERTLFIGLLHSIKEEERNARGA